MKLLPRPWQIGDVLVPLLAIGGIVAIILLST